MLTEFGTIVGIFGKGEYPEKAFLSLPPHWSLSVRIDIFLYGSIDNEWARVFLDNVQLGEYAKLEKDGDAICGDGYALGLGDTYYNDKPIFYGKNITHNSPNFNFKITNNYSDVVLYERNDEAVGFKHFFVHIDTCFETCS